MNQKRLSLTEGNIYKALAAFLLPILLGNLIQQLYVSVDAVIVGQFAGKAGLAAIDSVHTLFKFPINFMNGLSAGAAILISGYFGAKNEKAIHRSIRTACTLSLIIGIVSAAGGVFLAPQLLRLMQVPEDIYPMTLLYTRIYFSGLWALILYNMAAGILRAQGDSRRPLIILLLSSAVNIVGDLLLVGALKLGVAGAAAATVCAQILSMAAAFMLLSRSSQGTHGMEHRNVWYPYFHAGYMSRMIKTGLPLALQAMLFPIANSIVQAGVNSMGTDHIAAWGVCGKMDMLIWLIADSMSPALTTYTAQNIGAKKKDRVKKGVLAGAGMSAAAVGLVSLLLFAFPGVIGRWFISAADADTILPYVVQYMRRMAPFYIFYAFAEAFSGACCGTGDTLRPMITTLITICLLRVAGIWLLLPRYPSMECILWIYIVSWIAAGTAFGGLYYYDVKKNHF